jgi:hypothetical protein
MNRSVLYVVPLLLGALLCPTPAGAQPEGKPGVPADSTYSLLELERFIGGRTLLTIDLKEATLEEVAAALSKSSGQKIAAFAGPQLPTVRMGPNGLEPGEPLPLPRFTISAKDKPFWEAVLGWQLDAINRAGEEDVKPGNPTPTGLPTFDIAKSDAGFVASSGNGLTRGRAVVAWPFLVLGTELRRSQDASLRPVGLAEPDQPHQRPNKPGRPASTAPETPPGATPEEKRWNDRLTLSTQLYVDPKLSPSGLTCEIVEAVDGKGNDLRLPEDATRIFGGRSDAIQIPLSSRPAMGKRLAKLRGVLHFSVVTRSKHWETDLLQTPVEDVLQLDGNNFTVRFKGVKPEAGGWSAVFTAESRGGHLKRFWESRFESSNPTGLSAVWGGTNPTGVLDFTGTPQIDLVDAGGRSLRGMTGGSRRTLRGTTSGNGAATSAPATLDASPVPADVAVNWTYTEEQTVNFRPEMGRLFRTDGLTLPRTPPIGPPVKLIVDFPIEHRQVSVPFEFTDLPLPPS